jgi:uncharacterized protein
VRAYVDANVLVCYLTGKPPDMAAEAAVLFAAVEHEQVELVVDTVTVAECVWVLTSYHRLPAAQVARVLGEMLSQDGIVSPDREVLLLALAFYRDRGVDFADALVAARMLSEGEASVFTFDRHFARFPSLRRLRPRDLA